MSRLRRALRIYKLYRRVGFSLVPAAKRAWSSAE